jgi:hydroxylamine reductase
VYCFQCQETARNEGCSIRGICGKAPETADLQDLLIYVCKGISVYGTRLGQFGPVDKKYGRAVCQGLFVTVTNVAWDNGAIVGNIREALAARDAIQADFLAAYKAKNGSDFAEALPDCAAWSPADDAEILAKAASGEVRIAARAADYRVQGDCRLRRACRRAGTREGRDLRLHHGSTGFDDEGPFG